MPCCGISLIERHERVQKRDVVLYIYRVAHGNGADRSYGQPALLVTDSADIVGSPMVPTVSTVPPLTTALPLSTTRPQMMPTVDRNPSFAIW